MSKLGDKVLTEKTRVQVTIANFVMLIFSIISAVVFLVNWKSDIENQISNNEKKIIEIEQELKESGVMLLDNQTKLIEIQTDLKWIINNMESDK